MIDAMEFFVLIC